MIVEILPVISNICYWYSMFREEMSWSYNGIEEIYYTQVTIIMLQLRKGVSSQFLEYNVFFMLPKCVAYYVLGKIDS